MARYRGNRNHGGRRSSEGFQPHSQPHAEVPIPIPEKHRANVTHTFVQACRGLLREQPGLTPEAAIQTIAKRTLGEMTRGGKEMARQAIANAQGKQRDTLVSLFFLAFGEKL
jgi:hypothetical protein